MQYLDAISKMTEWLISVHFQGKPFNITVIQAYAPTSNAEEAEVERFCPEPDILECEVKWALESITMNKACGGDGIPVELFQILKDDSVKTYKTF